MEPINVIRSRTVVLPSSNIDTDQIIPARFLTTTTREGLGAALFADWRYEADGQPKADFVLNRPRRAAARFSWRAATSAADRRASTPRGRCSTTASAP
jgi:3-isopropylmalate/(R)-2-methylmalate dehydratase small subunit